MTTPQVPWVPKPLLVPTPVQLNFANGRRMCNPWYEVSGGQVLTGEEYGFLQ